MKQRINPIYLMNRAAHKIVQRVGVNTYLRSRGGDIYPELCTNYNLNQWENDDPVGFVVSTEDANNFVTEESGVGARIVTDGSLIAMRWGISYNSQRTYRCTITVESVSGSWDLAFMRDDWNPSGEPVTTVTTPGTHSVEGSPIDFGWYAGIKRTFGGGAGQIIISTFSIREQP